MKKYFSLLCLFLCVVITCGTASAASFTVDASSGVTDLDWSTNSVDITWLTGVAVDTDVSGNFLVGSFTYDIQNGEAYTSDAFDLVLDFNGEIDDTRTLAVQFVFNSDTGFSMILADDDVFSFGDYMYTISFFQVEISRDGETGDPIGLISANIIESANNEPVPNPNVDPVPEPATMILFGTGLLGLAGIRRKKK